MWVLVESEMGLSPVHASFGSSRIGLGDRFGRGTADSGGPNTATADGTNKLELDLYSSTRKIEPQINGPLLLLEPLFAAFFSLSCLQILRRGDCRFKNLTDER